MHTKLKDTPRKAHNFPDVVKINKFIAFMDTEHYNKLIRLGNL